MRIVSACRSYGNGGGMENVVHDRAVALRALGHEVTVVHASDGLYSDEFAAQCVDQCDLIKPDIIHLDSFDGSRQWWVDRPERVAVTLHSNAWSSFFSKWNLWMHDRAEHPGMSYTSARRHCGIIRTFDVAIAIGRYEHDLLRDACNVPDAKLVYNPIAPEFFDTPTVPPPADGYFMHIGKQVARGWDIAKLAALSIGAEIRSVSGVSRQDMVAVYDGCKALVLPTFRADGYDLTVAEAEARCRPSFVGATGNYLAEAGGGIVATPLGLSLIHI